MYHIPDGVAIDCKQLLEIIRTYEDATATPEEDPANKFDRTSLIVVAADDRRSSRRSMHSVRLSLQVVGERVIQKSSSRMATWRNTIIATERKRLKKSLQDLSDIFQLVQKSRLTYTAGGNIIDKQCAWRIGVIRL